MPETPTPLPPGHSGPSLNPARVDFVTLKLFCAVAQTGSITRGAAQCHLALSAASRRLADFEQTTGASLLERSSQGVRLTPAGHLALQHASRLFQGFQIFGNELSDFAEGYRGHVRLWANMSALTEFLPNALADFMGRHPEIHVDIEEQLSSDITRALREGLADIGVFAEGTPADGLDARPYRIDQLVLVCRAEHPLAAHEAVEFGDCLRFAMVGLNRGSSLLELMNRMATEHNRRLRLRVQVRSFDAMCQMIAANLGVGILPEGACREALPARGLVARPLTDAWARRQLLVATNPDTPLSRPAQWLLQHLAGQDDTGSEAPQPR